MIPIVSSQAAPLYVLLGARGLPLSTLFSIAAPLAALGADRVGVGRGGVLGIANAIWAVAAIAGPIVAGLLDDHVAAQRAVDPQHRAVRRRGGLDDPDADAGAGRGRLAQPSVTGRWRITRRNSVWPNSTSPARASDG